MEKNEEKALKRNLEQKHFENAAEAIKGGKESGSLTNVKLVENLVESYKGKTARTPIEVIITSAIFLNARELISVIEALKDTLRVKMVEELKEKADKGEATAEDAMTALMLAAIMKKESEKINKHE
jgi:hypothetical protein